MLNKRSNKLESQPRRICLVVGATGGIGRAVVGEMIANDFFVIIVGRKKSELESLTNKYTSQKIIMGYVCDLNQPSKIKQMLSAIKKKIGRVHCIVNCSGLFLTDDACLAEDRAMSKMINVNFISAYRLLEGSYSSKIVGSGGAIVIIGSVRGRTGVNGNAKIYSALKAGLMNLTKSFALIYSQSNVRVNCVAPGPVYPTKMSENWDDKKKMEIIKNTPLKFISDPKNIADAVNFLVSSASLSITGETLDVNGGMWMN